MPAEARAVSVIYEEDAVVTCYALTRSHTGQGSDPTADPANSPGCGAGQYVAGTQIVLTAVPAAGWHVAGWSGSNDDAGTSTTNDLIMPSTEHTITVMYVKSAEATFSALLPFVVNSVEPSRRAIK